MVMWLLSADVWFWQLPIHPHTHGLQSVKFSKMWHLTSAYMKCVYGWAYATSQPNFLGWIVYQIFLPMVLRKRALRNMQRNGQPRMNSRYRGYKFISYILSDSVWVNLSENMVRAFFTCEWNVSTNHSAPTKSNRVFRSFVFSLKVLFFGSFAKKLKRLDFWFG